MKKYSCFVALISSTESLSQKSWRTQRHTRLEKIEPNHTHRIYTAYDANKDKLSDGVTILDWWGKKQSAPATRKLAPECGGCWLTNDQSMEKTADGILLDNTRFVRHSRLDKLQKPYYRTPDMDNRNPDQYWIFWPREAASKTPDNACDVMEGEWDSAFNLTTSYRRDSDIPREFGDYQTELKYARYKKKANEWSERMTAEAHVADILAQKTARDENYVSWLVSNCDNTGGADLRYVYVQRMIEEGLKMDGFGHCFNNVISDRPWAVYMADRVQWGQFAKYKFYLAFENSVHCTDYMSEKFWRNSIRQGIVPVVSGTHPDDVKAMAPPNSYIHVEDFKSPGELVHYLEYLNQNDTAYLEYHAWRLNDPDWSLQTYAQPEEKMICGICHELNERKKLGHPKRIIPSVSNWWWINVHDDQCTAGSMLPDWVRQMDTVSMATSFDEKNIQRNMM